MCGHWSLCSLACVKLVFWQRLLQMPGAIRKNTSLCRLALCLVFLSILNQACTKLRDQSNIKTKGLLRHFSTGILLCGMHWHSKCPWIYGCFWMSQFSKETLPRFFSWILMWSIVFQIYFFLPYSSEVSLIYSFLKQCPLFGLQVRQNSNEWLLSSLHAALKPLRTDILNYLWIRSTLLSVIKNQDPTQGTQVAIHSKTWLLKCQVLVG
jgi:hypothetical protein